MSGRPLVVHAISRLNVGGPALLLDELASGLGAHGYDVAIVTGEVTGPEADARDLGRVRADVHLVDSFDNSIAPWATVRAWRDMGRILRSLRPVVVHTHGTKAGALGRAAARHAGVSTIVHTYHGHHLYGYTAAPVVRALYGLERQLQRRATTGITAIGQRVLRELQDVGVGVDIPTAVLHPGVRLDARPPGIVARRRLGLAVDRPVVAFVGRLAKIKRVDRFLDAAEIIRRSHPDTQFIIVGGGDRTEELARKAREMDLGVTFLGWRKDVEVVLSAADVIVSSSDSEGMPLTLIEAALAATPVVATDVGSTAEVVDHGRTGLVVAPTAAALAGGAGRLLDHPDEARAMGRRAQARATSRFDPDLFVAEVAAFYSRLLGADRAPLTIASDAAVGG